MNKKILAIITLLCHICLTGFAEQVNPDIKKVHIIFKTHLDIGFTDISSVIEKRYVDNFIPKAIDLAEKLRAEGGEERYVWTTGSWVIGTYLQQAEKSQVERLDKAIKQGDIVWNSLPYTTTTETLTKDHLRSLLRLSEWLDNKYDKKTISGKFTDVPGHTRAIVPVLQEAGIKLLHIGVNKQSYAPEVPEISIWHDEQSNSEVMLMLVGHYGTEVVLPDNQTAVGVFFTGDNIGPHSEKEVKAIYAKLRKKYPNAKLVASTLCNVANELETMKAKLPVITEELADTWIHGMGGSPDRMAKYRTLERLYTKWVNEKKWILYLNVQSTI